MHYRKNFLNNVILRLDFEPIINLITDKELDIEFSKVIYDKYPCITKKPVENVTFEITSSSGSYNKTVQIQWLHRDKAEGRKIVSLYYLMH